MKKLVVLSLSAILLTACGTNEEVKQVSDTSKEEVKTEAKAGEIKEVSVEATPETKEVIKEVTPKTSGEGVGYYEIYKENLEVGLDNALSSINNDYAFTVGLSNIGETPVEVKVSDFYIIDGNGNRGKKNVFRLEDTTEVDTITIEPDEYVQADIDVELNTDTSNIYVIYTEDPSSDKQVEWRMERSEVAGTDEYISELHKYYASLKETETLYSEEVESSEPEQVYEEEIDESTIGLVNGMGGQFKRYQGENGWYGRYQIKNELGANGIHVKNEEEAAYYFYTYYVNKGVNFRGDAYEFLENWD